IGLVLQIAIVVAAVLLFSFFDPFNLLKSKKLFLENTPVNVKSIREIGQLITAEYYGEVLNSLQQSRINQVIEENENYEDDYKEIHRQYQESITELIDDKESYKISKWNKKNDLYEYFYYRFSSLTANPYYQDYLLWLLDKMNKKNEKQLLKYFYTDSDDALKNLNGINIDLLKDIENITNERLNSLSADKKFRKQQIVVLGRGWVKAGIDFGKFTNQNFKYDKEKKTIHLIGMKPEILSCTINPWFIPEKQVKGFEVILVSRKANRPKFMQIVKEETLKKLRNNALEANILQQAKKNAEVNLKDFFSLLIEDGIDDVIIHDDFFSYFDVSMSKDSLNPGAMRSIDSLFVRRFYSDSLEVVALRDTIKKHRQIYIGNAAYKIQRFSSLLSLIEDEELSSGELAKMVSIRDCIYSDRQFLADTITCIRSQQLNLSLLDTIWFFPDKKSLFALTQLLNHEKILRRKKPFSTWKIITNNEEYATWDSIRTERYHRLIYAYMIDKKMEDFQLIERHIKDGVSQVVMNDITIIDQQSRMHDDPEDTTIDQHRLLFTDDIYETIKDTILLKKQIEIDSTTFKYLAETLNKRIDPEKPYLIISLRDSIQKKYIIRLSKSYHPLNRFSYLLFLSDIDSVNHLIQIEEAKIPTDLDSIEISNISNNIILQDSIWFYPSVLTLGEFNQKTNKKFPEQNFGSFLRKTFSKKNHIKWQNERKAYYHNLIYKYMLKKKSEELDKTKSILLKESKLARL
ncbi:MAG: DUF4230 domain-containing protein, partial [Cyclobacteriaceae bacterium]|nr:DUF4230 domain-containing protein [Cyclobacteriaceae bacterium]